MRIIRSGDVGDDVRDVQTRLVGLGHRIDLAEADGHFGRTTDHAVRAFQSSRGLLVDGKVGPDTWGRLVEAGWRLGDRTLYLKSPNLRGDDVLDLQHRLNELGFEVGKEDGIFGRRTQTAVVDFQRNVGEGADGIVGLGTVRALERVKPTVPGPSRSQVREAEALREGGAAPTGAVVAVDAEPALAAAIATALGRGGSRPEVVVGETPSERAVAANEARAAAYVAVAPGEDPTRAVVFHWGTPTTHSPAGRLLAEGVAEELAAEGVAGVVVEPLAIATLRETRMPAIVVDVPRATAAAMAAAVARGVARFLGA